MLLHYSFFTESFYKINYEKTETGLQKKQNIIIQRNVLKLRITGDNKEGKKIKNIFFKACALMKSINFYKYFFSFAVPLYP